MTFYGQLLDVLKAAGVRRIFGVPGDALNPLVDALRRQDDIRFIHVAHEEAGAFAASAEAKLDGQLAVCVGTVGPGAIHLLNGLYDAAKDRAPVLAITGQVPSAEMGFNYHQEIDLHRLFADVAVFQATVRSPEQMPRIAVEACHSALSERGVAVLSVPHDLGGQSVDDHPFEVLATSVPASMLPAEHDLHRTLTMLRAADRVTIFYGEGCRYAADPLLDLARRLQAPMVYSLRAKDLIAADHPHVAGGLGLLGTRGGLRAVEECDLLLVLGSDFPYRDWYPSSVPIIRVDTRGRHLGRRTARDIGLVGNCESVMRWWLDRLEARTDQTHLEAIQRERALGEQSMARLADPARSSDVIHPQAVAAAAGALARSDAIFTCDTGAVTVWASRHLRLNGRQRLLMSFNLASMAFAMPAALGVQLAHPDRQVISLSGDGGFNMLMGDLLTAVKYSLPIKVILFNNGQLGLIQMEQEAEGYPSHETDLQNPDYARLAESFGVRGACVTRPDELTDAVAATFKTEGPALLDVHVAPSELTMPPRIEPGQAWGFAKAKVREWLLADAPGEEA